MINMKRIFSISLSFLLLSIHGSGQTAAKDTVVTLNDIVVLASRKPEQLMAAPTSVQFLGKKYFDNNPSSGFFDALANAKGMQMITPSMGFRILNTRGFNNTTNVRFVQTVDGLDIQSPHIGSPIGNALGPSDLDIEKVELLPGVAATIYGMNAINGLADFTSKDPFRSPGLSFLQKTALTHTGSSTEQARVFSETSLRYATTLSKQFAIKFNISYMQGYDWIADDRTDLNPLANSSTGLTESANPAADPANGYGNESANRRTLALGGKNYVVARTGYYERDVVDYGLRNLKGDLTLKWRSRKGTEVSYTARMANLDNVYQRANRFRLTDYLLQQHSLQVIAKGFKANVYYNTENTGSSYNLRSMAENMDRSWKSDSRWFTDYANAFNSATNLADLANRHALAREAADRGRFMPGTASFQQQLERLQNINNWDSGAALQVRAAFVQADLQWDLTGGLMHSFKKVTGIDLLGGLDLRQHITVPDGNYFINPLSGKTGENLLYKKAGAYLSAQRELLNSKLKLGFALRADKNDYFKTYLSPRFTSVWRPNTRSTFRFNAQIGYRFPIIFEAFSNVNSGGVKRVGGLPVMSNGIFENGWIQSSIAAFQSAVIADANLNAIPLDQAILRNAGILKKSPYTYLKPEQVKSLEIGFRKLLLNNRLLIDADAYLNQYRDFIAQVNMNVPMTNRQDSIPFYLYDRSKQKPYRMWTNSNSQVSNVGFGIGLTYYQPRSVMILANVNYTRLTGSSKQDGLEDGFNTPAWSASATLSTHECYRSWKAALSWRWQDSFQWVSFLVSGKVPSYQTIDASVEHSITASSMKIKLGANNLLNTPYRSFLGGPSVGGFYYLSISIGVK